jgi:hypothetical protein
MKDWRSLGATHRRRDHAAASITQGRVERESGRSVTSLARWPAIVSAIRAVVASYNEGVGGDRLAVTETNDRRHPSVMIESTAGTIPVLVLTLDEAEIRVDNGSTSHPGEIKRWVDLTRSDEDTAAYVLQEWLERL